MPKHSAGDTAVLTVRIPASLERKLSREAKRRRCTRSEAARVLLEAALEQGPGEDPAAEARRQSRLASRRASDQEALAFIADVADLRGWA